MKRLSLFAPALLVVAIGSISCNVATAQDAAAPDQSSATEDKQWYYGPTGSEAEPKPLGRLRSEQRARQRLTRMESMRWYGFSASRPTASGMPFTTMYAPAWSRPGGRPFAWYTSQRPVGRRLALLSTLLLS